MSGWPVIVRLGQNGRFPFCADSKARMEIAEQLHLDSLDRFEGEISVVPWLDGARLDGHFEADLAQICGVTAEPLPIHVHQTFSLTVLPPGSPHVPQTAGEIEIDPDVDDPPDILDDETLDLTAYAFEHLALDLDPFPRKPGAEFTPPTESGDGSPFAVLKVFKPREDGR